MPTRRQFITQSALALAAARPWVAQQASSNTPILRKVAQGDLRGELAGLVQVFRGIPYAEPPVGGLRFRAPRPPRHWSGIRSATSFAAAATQPRTQEDFAQSEDCLYLNIWAPQEKGSFPVFVWIHGGGFTAGRPMEPLYDGTHFAQAGIICITVAYRLGVFGFLDVSEFFGPAYTASADNALLDLIAALRWIQSNVAAFGGDPGRVTIGGESAGAKLTGLLMGVPEAQPLFQQVISESGGAERFWSEDRARTIAGGFGNSWTRGTDLELNDLLKADSGKILNVQTAFLKTWPEHFPLRPELNPTLIPETPLTAIRNGSSRKKRMLLGTNRDESALFLGPQPEAVTARDLGNLTLAQFEPLEARYRNLYPNDSAALRRIHAVTAEEYWIPSLRVADAHIRSGGEAYVYRLDLPGRGRYAGLAFHSYDLRFVWDDFGKEPSTNVQQQLANGMHAAWISFIKGQRPSGPGLPDWPRYSLEKRPTMIFDHVSHIEYRPNEAEFKLWDGFLET
jgi:para-nitrobenzyl esterase